MIDSLTLLKATGKYNTSDTLDTAIQKIASLKTKSPFTQFKDGTKLTKGIFSGTMHCELCLAVLVYLADSEKPRAEGQAIEALLKEFKVIVILSTACILLMLYYTIKRSGFTIGLSKRSYPVCTAVISFLSCFESESSGKFGMRGSHSSVSGCTLPTFLPQSIRSEVELLFGTRLRAVLETMYAQDTLPQRPTSTDSHKLPFGSIFKPDFTRLQTIIKQSWIAGLPGLRQYVSGSG